MKKTKKPYTSATRLGAIAGRLALPEHARYVYWALANVLAPCRVVHDDRVVAWFERLADGRGCWQGPIVDWARALKGALLAPVVANAIKTLTTEGLVVAEPRTFQRPDGATYDALRLTIVPVEEWESERHFMAALAVRW